MCMSKNIIVSVTPNSIADIKSKLTKAEHDRNKYLNTSKILNTNIKFESARKPEIEIRLQKHIENLKSITQHLSAEQIKLTQANKTLETNRGVIDGWVKYVDHHQNKYDVYANNKIIYSSNIKILTNDIAIYQQAYDKSNSNRAICLDNIKYYDEKINEAQSSIQLCKNNRAVCSKNILTHDKNISILQSSINEADRVNQPYLDDIKKFNDNLPIFIRAYGDHVEYPREINRETFYVDKEVRTKHRTSILGINAEPYYTSHNERVFNQAGYNKAVVSRNKERNTFDEKKDLIKKINENIASLEEVVSSNNKIKSNAQTTLSQEIQSKQTDIANMNKYDDYINQEQIHLDKFTLNKQKEIKALEKFEGDIIMFKQCLDKEKVQLQENVELLAKAENDIILDKTELDKAIASKLSIEKKIAEAGNQVKNLQEQIARYNTLKKVQEENVRIAKEEINQINILVQNTLKNEQELATRVAKADRIIDALKSQLNNLNKESAEELLSITEEVTLQEGMTDISTISNYLEKVDLAGSNHIPELL